MTSLSDVYEGGVRTAVDRRRRVLAMGLFATGMTMGAVAILLTTTGLRSWAGLDVVGARAAAGLLAGLGLPVAMVGVLSVLPASDETRAAAAIGTSVAVFGVLLFVYAYPDRWLASEPALAVATVAIYALGVLVTFWCLFLAVATFDRRDDPGGNARVEVTDEGTLRLVSRESSEPDTGSGSQETTGVGGVGLLGRDPDGDVPTQTNDSADTASDSEPGPAASVDRIQTGESGTRPEPTSDGGPSVTQEAGTEVISAEEGQPDAYCGNCAYFEYVEVAGDLDPYCRYHQEFMDDLEACDRWTANTSDE